MKNTLYSRICHHIPFAVHIISLIFTAFYIKTVSGKPLASSRDMQILNLNTKSRVKSQNNWS